MDLSPFKKDIDELIDEFVQWEMTALADMKRVWLSRQFSYIYEASPYTNSFFLCNLCHMVSTAFLQRLGGLYCLYETQPFKPPFNIYISIGELKKLKFLVVEAKDCGIRVVLALVKRILEKNIFLFGFVDLNEGSIAETVNQLTDLQNTRVQAAYEKLFASTRICMDLCMEVDLHVLKKMSMEYAEAKNQAIEEASKMVDVQNVKHMADAKKLMGDVVEKISDNWNVQRELFYQQTGLNEQPVEAEEKQLQLQCSEEGGGDDEFGRELEQLLGQT